MILKKKVKCPGSICLLPPFPEQKRGGNILSNHSLDVCQARDILFLLPAMLIKPYITTWSEIYKLFKLCGIIVTSCVHCILN